MSWINPFSKLSGLLSTPLLPQNTSALNNIQAIAESLPGSLQTDNNRFRIEGQIATILKSGQAIFQTKQGDIQFRFDGKLPQNIQIGAKAIASNLSTSSANLFSLNVISQNKSVHPAPSLPPATVTNLNTGLSSQNDVQALQTVGKQASQANQTILHASGSLKTGQALTLTPLPQTLNSIGAIASQFTKSNADTVMNTKLNTVPQNIPSNSLSGLMPTIRFSNPDTVSFLVSGDRTIRPIIQNLAVHNVAPSSTLVSTDRTIATANTADARIALIIEPLYISPPISANATISATLNKPSMPLSLMDIKAGQLMTVSTGYQTADNQPIVQIMNGHGAAQHFATLNYPTKALPQGTIISFTPISSKNSTPFSMSAPSSIPSQWDDLHGLLPPALMQAVSNTMPAIGGNTAQFPAAALLFLAAANAGDISAWLGPKSSQALRDTHQGKSQPNMQKLLSDLLGNAKGRTPDRLDPPQVQGQDWRGYQLPHLHGQDLHLATLWVQREHIDHNSASETHKTQRFFVDLHLTRMGQVQLDGMINVEKQSFNLAIQTDKPLSDELISKLQAHYARLLEGLGYHGNLRFKQ